MARSTDTLITELASASEASREAAIARLAIVGPRAVDRLVEFASSTSSSAGRVAALTALERIGDWRALAAALPLAADSDVEVALAAIAVAAAFVRDRQGVQAIDRLTALAVDESRPSSIRAAAVEALRPLGASTIRPLVERLSSDPALKFAAPAAMRTRVAASVKAPLPSLLKIVEEIRERERTASRDERAAWLEVRGEAHALLAHRRSTIALYDLRETIAAAKAPLPAAFLVSATAIGDASCLEPIAAAYAAAKDLYWKKSLADAFQAIVKRRRITKRHKLMQKLREKGLAIAT